MAVPWDIHHLSWVTLSQTRSWLRLNFGRRQVNTKLVFTCCPRRWENLWQDTWWWALKVHDWWFFERQNHSCYDIIHFPDNFASLLHQRSASHMKFSQHLLIGSLCTHMWMLHMYLLAVVLTCMTNIVDRGWEISKFWELWKVVELTYINWTAKGNVGVEMSDLSDLELSFPWFSGIK